MDFQQLFALSMEATAVDFPWHQILIEQQNFAFVEHQVHVVLALVGLASVYRKLSYAFLISIHWI
jgi:hypothetical protein